MLGYLFDITADTAIWGIKNTYYVVHYMIYGHIETAEEKMRRSIEDIKLIECNRNIEMNEILHQIKEIKENELVILNEIRDMKNKFDFFENINDYNDLKHEKVLMITYNG